MNIREHFEHQRAHHGNICEHMDTLRRYAETCSDITELGVCGLGSTWAFLDAKPRHLVSVDPVHPDKQGGNLAEAMDLAKDAGIVFSFIEKDDTEIEIDPTELLFIDTLHDYVHLSKELKLHAPKASKFIIMHDTETFGYPSAADPKGMNRAIDEFLIESEEGRNWQMIERFTNCHGLMVLARQEYKPRIKVVTFFYNEEFLIPFYLSHYWFTDIHAVVSKCTDRTRDLLEEESSRVLIEEFEMPDGYDHHAATAKMNQIITRKTDYDWLILAESDEYVWPVGNPTCTQAFISLANAPEHVVYANMWQVYRNESESDLDATQFPVVTQRRHGDPDRQGPFNRLYCKPIIIRPNNGIEVFPGLHFLQPNRVTTISGGSWDGAHWANADLAFSLERRLKNRRDHVKETDFLQGLGVHNSNITEESLRLLCDMHRNDPKLF